MFMALFTIAKMWKQPKCPSVDEWISKMWYTFVVTYNGILFSLKNSVICHKMDEP